jgi:RNA polymerase sigma-70 factor (ECF subfamily)
MSGNFPGDSAADASDDELLAAARRGDAAALNGLLVRYQPQLYRFGMRMCGNAEDAGDVTQESLISMARSLRDFRGDASVSTWLYTIARRFCLKKRRRSKFAPPRDESLEATGKDAQRLADPTPNPEQAAANSELAAVLAGAIGRLDPRQREVLILRDVEGLSAPEVATILGVTVDTVKSRLHRARVAVRQELAPVLRPAGTNGQRPSRCPDVVTLFSQHLEGDIDPAVCAAMERHLLQCGYCRTACETLRRTLRTCRELPSPEVPASVAASVKAALTAFLQEH